MRLSNKFFIVFLILTAMFAAAAVWFFFLPEEERIDAAPDNIALKEFTFTSKENLTGWEEKVLAPRKTDYAVAEENGEKSLKASADDSASTLFYKEKLAFQEKPAVSWEWKVETFPSHKEKETLKQKSEFDFAAQFYVMFYSRSFLKTKAIQYVWAETLPVGTTGDNPYTSNVKIMVLESGKSEGWKREERDIDADYLALFGVPLDKDVAAVAFMTDSDSTDSKAVAFYRNVSIGYEVTAAENPEPEKKPGFIERIKRVFKKPVGKKATDVQPADKADPEKDKGKELPSST